MKSHSPMLAHIAPIAVCVAPESPAHIHRRAEHLAAQQQLQIHTSDEPQGYTQYPYVIFFSATRVSLVSTGKHAPGPVFISFVDGTADHRRKYGGGKNQLIAKALGLNKNKHLCVVDATAGLARDAFVMASLGAKVTLLERSPYIAELLHSALALAAEHDVASITANMQLVAGDARTWLSKYQGPAADVVYLDPMFPAREKSALVKKEMRVFHDLVGTDGDEAELLAAALICAQYRVVVKRPRLAEAISGPKPTYQLAGKTTRYDIYVRAAFPSNSV